MHRARFGTLAVRANALYHHVMTQDTVAGFLLQRFVIGAVIGVGNIHHAVTDQTVYMIVRIGPEVKAVAAGHDHPIDLPVVAEQVQVSIDGPAADMGILLPDALVDLLRSGVVPAAPDHVQNQLPLTGVALLLHAHAPFFVVMIPNYSKGMEIMQEKGGGAAQKNRGRFARPRLGIQNVA